MLIGKSTRTIVPRRWIPAVVLGASLILTAAASFAIWTTNRVRDRARFQNAVQSVDDRIEGRLEIYIALLRATAGLFAAEEVSRVDFFEFVANLELAEHYPGIQGIGFARRVVPDSVRHLVAGMHAEGATDFEIFPEGVRPEYFPIVYLEPLDARNQVAIGYDMFSNETRRVAMERARDEGQAALSGKVRLVQEIDPTQQAGFLIYVPVYDEGVVPPTQQARRVGLKGFAYAPFRGDDLFQGIFGSEEPRVEFSVFDGVTTDPTALLHSFVSGIAPGRSGSTLADTARLEIAGHAWTLVFRPSAAFAGPARQTPLIIVTSAGVLMSLMLFGLSRGQQRARIAAERSELEAEWARGAAEEANRAKTQFLAKMSHELRTPLNAIAGYVDLLDLGIRGPITPEQRHDLHRIKYAQEHLLGLINDVLNFARIEAGRVDLQLEEVSIAHVVADVEMLIGPLAAAKEIAYRRTGGDALDVVRADPDKLEQVLLNLLSNAVKFTDRGGSVEMDWESHDGMVAIHVRDTGRGIPPHMLPSIFEPFAQVDAALTRTTGGTGLGLAISQEFARAMGGELTVESVEGVGSTFTLRLAGGAITAASAFSD